MSLVHPQSERRLQEGRPEPIDLIAKNLHLVEEFDFELEDPWRHFSGLLLENMERVADEIKEFKVRCGKMVRFFCLLPRVFV